MTILEFIKLFPGFDFHFTYWLVFLNGTYQRDLEYSYYGLSDDFEKNMQQYDWLFDIDLIDPNIIHLNVNKNSRIISMFYDKKIK